MKTRALLFFLLSVGWAHAVTIDWFNSTAAKVYYADGVTALNASTSGLSGCLLQLVYAGANKSNDPAQASLETTGVTWDDEVVDVGFFGWKTTPGPPTPTTDGLMQSPRSFDASAYVNGDVFFVRAWTAPAAQLLTNAPSLTYVPVAQSNRYGDSALFVYTAPATPNVSFNFGSEGGRAGWAAALSPNADTDTNGLPDWWVRRYFTNAAVSATNDYDGDGWANLDEYLADTDPTNAASYFRSIDVIDGYATPALSARSTSVHRLYDVWFKTSLVDGVSWTRMGVSREGTGGDLELSVTNSAPLRFYRIGAFLP